MPGTYEEYFNPEQLTSLSTKHAGIILLIVVFATFNSCKNEMAVSEESARKGEIIFNSSGCTLCHSVSGEERYGPPLNSLFINEVTVIRNGRKLSFMPDRKYIIKSMKYPEFEKLENYQNKKMPSVNLSPEDINYITDYLIYINRYQNSN